MLYYCDKMGPINNFNTEETIKGVFTSMEIEYFMKEKPHWKFEI